MRYAITGATINQVKSVGASDIKTTSIGIIFATLTEEQVARLKSQGCTVNKVGEVRAVVMPPVVAPPVPIVAAPTYSPMDLMVVSGFEDARKITDPPLYGEGFNLAIIDSGIRETHEQIMGRVIYSKNYTTDPMRDGLNHGTGVASIAVLFAPLCNILNLKVLNDKGEGTEEAVVLAMDDCINLQDTQPNIAPSVINLSLGSPDDGNPNNILRVACRAAIERNIWVIASAGNSGPGFGTITSPACERYVGAIGSAKYLAEGKTFVISSFSSRGPTSEGLIKPDAVFFGEDIEVAGNASDTATIGKSGTSFATPFISGVCVLLQESFVRAIPPSVKIPGLYPELVGVWIPIQEVLDTYTGGVCIKPMDAPRGKDVEYGNGLPFGPLFIQALKLVPAMDISTILQPIMGIITLAMLGMVIAPMVKTKE